MTALLDAGLLAREPQGRTVWYSIAPDQADRVAELLPRPSEISMSRELLDRISADLATRLSGVFAPETVGRYVTENYELLTDQTRTTRCLPSLTARFAGDRLAALAVEQRLTLDHVPEVLFVCAQNAGRSQLAAGIPRQLAGARVTVRTAGSAPAGAVRSIIVTALDEIGVSIDGEYPKPLTDEVVRAADVVVTMGCGDVCPIYPGRLYLDWDIEDPVGLPLARVRDIRDDIDARVRQLLTTLAMASPSIVIGFYPPPDSGDDHAWYARRDSSSASTMPTRSHCRRRMGSGMPLATFRALRVSRVSIRLCVIAWGTQTPRLGDAGRGVRGCCYSQQTQPSAQPALQQLPSQQSFIVASFPTRCLRVTYSQQPESVQVSSVQGAASSTARTTSVSAETARVR